MNLTLGWLYYDLMNTYGDRGNVLILKHRSKLRGIELTVKQITVSTGYKEILDCDLFMMGGAEDRQQKIVADDLVGNKRKALQDKIESGTPGMYVCGAYQFLGSYYETADGTKLECAGIIPFHTKQPDEKQPRLIGDLVVTINHPILTAFQHDSGLDSDMLALIGFENHGGRTYLGNIDNAVGTVLKGHGNNGTDKTEGLLYKNTIGTYCHGPMLVRNPLIADFLIYSALKVKYKKAVPYKQLDDSLEKTNRAYLLKKLAI